MSDCWVRMRAHRLLVLASTTAAFVPAALGQSDQTSQVLEIEEVVVTAQKRKQSIIKVPSSLTVFNAEQIDFNRIEDLEDFAIRTPSVRFNSTGNPSRSNVAIRGVSRLGGAFNSVGIYFDEFSVAPFSGNGAINPVLFELERIEVLRGPQGVLFGRNATAGAVNITTKKPSPDAVSGRLRADYSSFDTIGLKGYINTPVTDNLAMSLGLFYRDTNGFIDAVGDNTTPNDLEEFGGRFAARWTPNERLILDFWVSYAERQGGISARIPTGDVTATQAAAYAGINAITSSPFAPLLGIPPNLPRLPNFQGLGVFPDNSNTVAFDAPAMFENENVTLVGRSEFDLDFANFVLVGGFTDNQYNEMFDADFTNTPVFTGAFGLGLDTWSLEARLESKEPWDLGRLQLQWTVGGGYYDNSQDALTLFSNEGGSPFNPILFASPGQFGPGTPPGPLFGLVPGGPVNDTSVENDSRSWGLFANFLLGYADRIELQLGARLSRDSISTLNQSVDSTLLGPIINSNFGEESFSDFSPRATFSFFATDDVTLYATASRGYRAGGLTFDAAGETVPFDEEIVWNFESGVKASILDNRLYLSAAGFYLDWKDIQVLNFDFASGVSFTQNAAEASAFGVEVEFRSQITEKLSLSGNFGFVDAEFDDFTTAFDAINLVETDITGGDIPFTAPWTGSVAGRYDQPVTATITGFATIEYIFQGGFNALVVPNDIAEINSYELVNLRLGVETGPFTATFYIDNLLDEVFSTGFFNVDTTFVGALQTVGAPRMFGASLSVNF